MSAKPKAAPQAVLTHVRNMGIFAHVDAGKTTCTERILFFAGDTHKMGDVDDGNTVTDHMDQERERGITIRAAAVQTHWLDHTINLIDTPGHVDFTMEVERSMRVLDGGILVVCAKGGVQPQTRTVWRQANKHRVPRLVFVNKMDTIGADFPRVLSALQANLRSEFGSKPVALQLPIGKVDTFSGVIDLISMRAFVWNADDGEFTVEDVPAALLEDAQLARQELVETICETDDTLTDRFLAEETISADELKQALRRAVISLKLVPVLCGSAKASKGIQPLLDAIVELLPSPVDVPPVTAEALKGESVLREPKSDAPLAALVFKVDADTHGDLYFTRVYSGVIETGSYVLNSTKGTKERIGRIVKMQGAKRTDIDFLAAGDIGVLIGLRGSTTGDTLCTVNQPCRLESISFPDPVIWRSVESDNQAGADALSAALTRLAAEDPSFKLRHDAENNQSLVGGQGELHLEVTIECARRDYGVVVRVGDPMVSYRETVRAAKTTGIGDFQRQNGGRGMFAYVVIELEPLPRGSGFMFVDSTIGGAVPKQFIPSVEKGVRGALGSGGLTNSPVVDVKVTLVDGKFHAVDSNDMAFQVAGSMAFRDAFRKASPVILEPTMSIEVEVPSEFVGNVLGDLGSRRGKVTGSDMTGRTALVRGLVPLAETFGYTTFLRNSSRGEGSSTLEFSHDEPVPAHIAAALTEQHRRTDD